jgi:hypothetical protein
MPVHPHDLSLVLIATVIGMLWPRAGFIMLFIAVVVLATIK